MRSSHQPARYAATQTPPQSPRTGSVAPQCRLPGFEEQVRNAVHRGYNDGDIRRRPPHMRKRNPHRLGIADSDATKLEHLGTRGLHERPEYTRTQTRATSRAKARTTMQPRARGVSSVLGGLRPRRRPRQTCELRTTRRQTAILWRPPPRAHITRNRQTPRKARGCILKRAFARGRRPHCVIRRLLDPPLISAYKPHPMSSVLSMVAMTCACPMCPMRGHDFAES